MYRIPILALALALASPALAAETKPAADHPQTTILRLEESASREVECDRLRAELALEVAATDPADAQEQLNRKMKALLPLTTGVPGVQAQAGNYTTYADRSNDRETTWRARESLSLRGRDPAAVLSLVGKLQQKGMALIQLTYELTPELTRTTESELTTIALQRLRTRAEQAARDLGLHFNGWTGLEIGSANQSPPPRPMLREAMAMSAAKSYTPPAAPAGTASVRVTVHAEAALLPPK